MRNTLRILAGLAIGTLAAVGLAVVLVSAIGILAGRSACVGDQCTWQAWAAALGGWFATIGALVTVGVLLATLRHMQKSSEQQLRAYICFDDAMLGDVGLDSFHLQVKIVNRGATPAQNVQVDVRFDLKDKADNKTIHYTRGFQKLGYVGPKEEAIQKIVLADYNGSESSLRDGDSFLNFSIWVTYDTAFGGRRFTSIEYESQFHKGWKDHPLVARFGMSKAD